MVGAGMLVGAGSGVGGEAVLGVILEKEYRRYLWRYTFVRITVLQRPGLCRYPGRRITHQYLTIYIENVIISVTTITKMLFVTRRAKMPLYGVFALGI